MDLPKVFLSGTASLLGQMVYHSGSQLLLSLSFRCFLVNDIALRLVFCLAAPLSLESSAPRLCVSSTAHGMLAMAVAGQYPGASNPMDSSVMPATPYYIGQDANIKALQALEQLTMKAHDLGLPEVQGLTTQPALKEPPPIALVRSATENVYASRSTCTPAENGLADRTLCAVPQKATTNQAEWLLEPKEADWTQMRPLITSLYKEHRLEEVVEIMRRRCNFKARYEKQILLPVSIEI